MGEQVLSTIIGGDEPESFGVIEPLDDTGSHT
jgi:hypothetical protein